MSLRGFMSALVVLGAAATVGAAPQQLAEWIIDRTPDGRWGMSTITDRIDHVEIRFGTTNLGAGGYTLFESAVVTTSSVGTSFVADATHDGVDFAGAVSVLSDGETTDFVWSTTGLRRSGWFGGGRTEADWASFNGALAEFTGYQITSIELFINSFSHESPGTNPNGDGNWTDYRVDRRVRIFGEVPEPTSSAATALIIAATALSRRRLRSA
jgi:hypothetical protein